MPRVPSRKRRAECRECACLQERRQEGDLCHAPHYRSKAPASRILKGWTDIACSDFKPAETYSVLSERELDHCLERLEQRASVPEILEGLNVTS